MLGFENKIVGFFFFNLAQDPEFQSMPGVVKLLMFSISSLLQSLLFMQVSWVFYVSSINLGFKMTTRTVEYMIFSIILKVRRLTLLKLAFWSINNYVNKCSVSEIMRIFLFIFFFINLSKNDI